MFFTASQDRFPATAPPSNLASVIAHPPPAVTAGPARASAAPARRTQLHSAKMAVSRHDAIAIAGLAVRPSALCSCREAGRLSELPDRELWTLRQDDASKYCTCVTTCMVQTLQLSIA